MRHPILIAILVLTSSGIHLRGAGIQVISESENHSGYNHPKISEAQGDTLMKRSMGRYVSVAWENDLYYRQDFYFTNGFQVDVFFNKLRGSPVIGMLIPAGNKKEGHKYAGLQLRQEIFTPKDLAEDSITSGDHPYASTLSLTHVAVYHLPDRLMRIATGLRLGIIGPASLGFRAQELAHRVSNPSRPPQGWEYQLRNDVIINCDLQVEKGMIRNDLILIGGMSKGRLGTLHTDLEAGLWLRLDPRTRYFNWPGPSGDPGLQFEFHLSTTAGYVIYDATLQGGLFNKTSPYVLSADDLFRWVGRLNIAATFGISQHQLEFFTQLTTPRFRMAVPHGWMGIAYKYWF